MIELGDIAISGSASIVEVREKIRVLAINLAFDRMGLARLVTVSSDLARIMTENQLIDIPGASIRVGLDKMAGRFGITLIFQGITDEVDIEKTNCFFDHLSYEPTSSSPTQAGLQNLMCFSFIPNPVFQPSQELIAREKENITRLSREALFHEVQKKTRNWQNTAIGLRDRLRSARVNWRRKATAWNRPLDLNQIFSPACRTNCVPR